MFRDSVFKKQLELDNETPIKPLSYFNTLPSGDIVSDAEFDTFLCDQMFQEDFEFTVADDMSIGKTTLRNSIGKRDGIQFNFLRIEKVQPSGQGKLKKLNTFHLGDKNVIPCSTGDHYSKEDFEKASGISSQASFFNDVPNQAFHSLRHIQNDEVPMSPYEISSPQLNFPQGKNIDLPMPQETTNFGGSFLKRPPSNVKMLSPGDETYIIEEDNEEDLAHFSNKSLKKVSSSNSIAKSRESESNEGARGSTPTNQATEKSRETKKRLMLLSGGDSKSENAVVRSSQQGSPAKPSAESPYGERVTGPKFSSDSQIPEIKKKPLAFLDLERDGLSLNFIKDLKDIAEETVSNNLRDNVSSTKGQRNGKSEKSEASSNANKATSISPVFPSLQRNHSIESDPTQAIESDLTPTAQRLSATCTSYLPLDFNAPMGKTLSEIEEKIQAVRLKTQMIDMAYRRAKEELDRSSKEEVTTFGHLSLEAIHEYRQLDSATSTIKNTPKKAGMQPSEANPFFQSVSKLAGTKKEFPSPGKTPSFQFSLGTEAIKPTLQTQLKLVPVSMNFSGALNELDGKPSGNSANDENEQINILRSQSHDSTEDKRHFKAAFLSSTQKQRLKNIVGLKKASDFNIQRGPRLEDHASQVLLSASVSKASEKGGKRDSCSPFNHDRGAFFTSRDKNTPPLSSNCQTRLSANSQHHEKAKHPQSSRKAILSLSALKSRLFPLQDSPLSSHPPPPRTITEPPNHPPLLPSPPNNSRSLFPGQGHGSRQQQEQQQNEKEKEEGTKEETRAKGG